MASSAKQGAEYWGNRAKRKMAFSRLSGPRQILIRLCQDINHGSILRLQVRNGEVDFDGAEIALNLLLDREGQPRSESDLSDFDLPAEADRLFTQIDSLKDGMIDEIVVHAGIPRRVMLRRRLTQAPV